MSDPTAEVRLLVHPVGVSGMVLFEINDVGPEPLSDAMMAWMLLKAYQQVTGRERAHPAPIEKRMDDDDDLTLAKLAYAAYGLSTDNKNYQGAEMPAWDDLTAPIKAAWLAAVVAVAVYLDEQ